MKIHELKTDPQEFEKSWRGDKSFEIRFDDRDFQPGDIVVLKETESDGGYMRITGIPVKYTGRQLTRRILSKTTGYGLGAGWCVIGLVAM